MTTDNLTAALDEIRANHQQHVSMNFPEPGICVSRDGSWPCDSGRLLAALDEVLKLHHPALGQPEWCEESGFSWPCSTHEAITRALLGEG